MEYQLIRSSRKTLAIEVRGTQIIVRAPNGCSLKRIDGFVTDHESWLKTKVAENTEKGKAIELAGFLSEGELNDLTQKARERIPERVAMYANVIGVSYGKITIRCQRTKWGSCSSKLDDLTKWANEVIAYAQDAAINHGKHWTGFKVVESKTNRKYTDEAAVVEAANAAGYYDIYKKSLISITEMEKLMGKKTFSEILGEHVKKPQGKPTLVPASDKRPAIITTGANNDFNEITEE